MIEKLKNKKRHIIQIITAILYNININGFKNHNIYTGKIKNICVPGLNCYSCPGAIASCPLGAFQQSLKVGAMYSIYYVLGFLILCGILLGRVICGYICPFGLIQGLLYKIKTKKINKNQITKKLSYIKYFILILFVILLPILYKETSFCKYICPAGTLEGGVLLVLLDKTFRKIIGSLYCFKITILIIIIIASIFIYRMFCRFICPLGAFYGLFNKISFVGISYNKNKCINCAKCISICKMDIKQIGDSECISCGECINICKEKIIRFGIKNNKKMAYI